MTGPLASGAVPSAWSVIFLARDARFKELVGFVRNVHLHPPSALPVGLAPLPAVFALAVTLFAHASCHTFGLSVPRVTHL